MANEAAAAAAVQPGGLAERDKLTIILGVLAVMLLAALDQTIVAPAMPTIGHALGDVEYLPWVITAYLLTGTATAPLYGKIADIYGRRSVIAAAVMIFVAGSVLAALAPTMIVLIIARAVQGLGGGGLFVLAQTVIGDTVPPKERAAYTGYISGTWAIASIAGPLLGGIFAEHLHWSLIFWINLPLGIAALIVLRGPLSKLPKVRRDHRLDFIGGALVLLATTPLMLALTWGGHTYAWSSPTILLLFAGSTALWVLLALRLLNTSEPLIPLEVLANRIVLTAAMGIFFGMAASVAIAVFIPIYFQAHLGLSVADSGFALIVFVIGTTIGAAVTGRNVSRLPRYKFLAIAGLAVAALCFGVLGIYSGGATLVVTEALLGIAGVGFGTIFPIGTVSVQNAVEYRNLGIATAILSFLRTLGSAIGVAAIGAVALASGLPAVGEGTGTVATGSADLIALAFRNVFFAAGVMTLIALAFFLAMPERTLRSTVEDSPATG